MRYMPAIDGLRAIAVLAVVAYHAGAPAGFVGVDVFFVISGYLITRLLREDGRLVEFYSRRARRILPAAVLCVVVTLALSFLLLPDPGDVARSAAAAGAFVSNFWFQAQTGGYWSADAQAMPLLHLWSLSVEEQFYLAWPLVLVFARKRPGILWWVFGVSLALYAWLSYADPNAAFYQTPARAWELTAGALIAFGMIRPVRGGVFLVLLACLVPLPVPVAVVLSVIGTAMVIACLHAGREVKWLAVRPMVWVGLISFSLYLWHWPLLAIDRALRVGEAPLSVRLVLVAIAFVLAILSYRYVEQPFRRARVRPARAVALGVMAAAALSTTAFALTPKKVTVADNPLAVAAEHDIPTRECHSIGIEAVRVKCASPGGTLVWGDSMAYAWRAAFPGSAGATRDACPPAVGHVPEATKAGRACRDFNDAVLPYAQQSDTVVLVWWWLRRTDATPLAKTLEALKDVHRVIIIGPTPVVADRVPKCLRLGRECGVSRASFDAEARPILDQLHALARDYPNVVVVDVSNDFCTATECPVVKDDVPLYWDTHHVTGAAARNALR